MSGLAPGEVGNIHSHPLTRTSPVPPLMASLYNRDFPLKFNSEVSIKTNENLATSYSLGYFCLRVILSKSYDYFQYTLLNLLGY